MALIWSHYLSPSVQLGLTLSDSFENPIAGQCIGYIRVSSLDQQVERQLDGIALDPLADVDPWLTAAVDWDRTIAFREHIWDIGLGVAEAMDTAQRGMGLDWPTSLELIQRSVRAAKNSEDSA